MPRRNKSETAAEPAAKRRSMRLREKPELPKQDTKKAKKAPVKVKKPKSVDKAKPEEKTPEAPAENGEAKAEEEAPGTDAADEKDETAE